MPKIVWVIHGRETYGERRAVVSLATGVRTAGWDVEVISLSDGDCYRELVAGGVKVWLLSMDRTPGLHLARSQAARLWEMAKLCGHQLSVARRLRPLLRRLSPDAVHVLSVNVLPAVGWAARRCGIPCFWEMTREFRQRPCNWNVGIFRTFVKHLRIHTLANSHFTATTLPELDPPAETMLLGEDPIRFDPGRVHGVDRASLGIPAHGKVFVIAARVDGNKGQDVFAQALAEVGDPTTHLILVGEVDPFDESYRKRFRESIQRPEMEGRVHWVGYSPTPEAFLTLGDVGVNARLDAESFGLSVVEAMLMGKPTLVHALGGPAETVVDGETGWHIGAPTVQAYAEGIRRCLAEAGRWREMGEAARRRAVEHFTIERQVMRYLSIVQVHLRNPAPETTQT
jgi:glycosyltransferase involved in cell wall biosynthesis